MKKYFSLKSLLTFALAIVAFVVLTSYQAFAAGADSAPDLTASLLALWQGVQNHASTALILVPVFQILRTHEVLGLLGHLSSKGMQIAVALITTGGFVVDALAKGQPLLQAAVTGLITSGGAMMIYDAIKGISGNNAAPPSA